MITGILSILKPDVMATKGHSFQVKITSSGFHVYIVKRHGKRVKVGDEVEVIIEENKLSKEIDPYCCAFKIRMQVFCENYSLILRRRDAQGRYPVIFILSGTHICFVSKECVSG